VLFSWVCRFQASEKIAMARKVRVEFEGAIYQVMCRGDRDRPTRTPRAQPQSALPQGAAQNGSEGHLSRNTASRADIANYRGDGRSKERLKVMHEKRTDPY
jgi:hypothetical protein